MRPRLLPNTDSMGKTNDSSSVESRQGEPLLMSIEAAGAALDELHLELNRLQRTIRQAIQSHLGRLAGRSLGSLELNQQMVQTVHDLLEGHGLRVQCSECGHPAILRVSPRAGIEHGVFVFDHTIQRRRTFHGGRSVMPELRLVTKPARKKAAS